jgi:hypothetical protein
MREEYQLQIITLVETLVAFVCLKVLDMDVDNYQLRRYFLQGVEYNCKVRPALKMPMQMGPLPEALTEKIGDPGEIPNLAELGLKYREQVCEV